MMKTKKNRLKVMILAYVVFFAALYVIIYIVPQVSGIFLKTYTAEYGLLEISADSSFVVVRDETVYIADSSGAVTRAASQGELMLKDSHIATVGGTQYHSEQQGIVSYYYDGLEAVYTPDNMQTMSYSTLKKLKKEADHYEVKECEGKSAASGTPVYKIIDNKQWYLVCWLEADDAEGYDPGKNITTEFSDGTQLKMKVINNDVQGEKNRVILSCDRYYEKFDRIRTGTCRLIRASRNGIILYSDSITEENGVKGVYVMSKRVDRATFVPVKILLSDGEKTVVEKDYFTNDAGQKTATVENYDEILKKPDTAQETKGSE